MKQREKKFRAWDKKEKTIDKIILNPKDIKEMKKLSGNNLENFVNKLKPIGLKNGITKNF